MTFGRMRYVHLLLMWRWILQFPVDPSMVFEKSEGIPEFVTRTGCPKLTHAHQYMESLYFNRPHRCLRAIDVIRLWFIGLPY